LHGSFIHQKRRRLPKRQRWRSGSNVDHHRSMVLGAEFIVWKQRRIAGAITTRWVYLEAAKAVLRKRTLKQRHSVRSPARIHSSKNLKFSRMPRQNLAMLLK